jgi:hypothetical protein
MGVKTGVNFPDLVLFVFDSTRPPQRGDMADPLASIAEGLVTKDECKRLVAIAEKVATRQAVPTPQGERILDINPEDCIRILTIHHHPISPNDKRAMILWGGPRSAAVRRRKFDPRKLVNKVRDWGGQQIEARKEMKGADYLVTACHKAGVNIVSFGHRHSAYAGFTQCGPIDTPFGAHERVYFFCCPTTLQWDSKKAGFITYKLQRGSFTPTLFQLAGTLHREIWSEQLDL